MDIVVAFLFVAPALGLIAAAVVVAALTVLAVAGIREKLGRRGAPAFGAARMA